jgi:predicted nucleotidyltransferase
MLTNSEVYLFGSRAREDYNQESDYDILIVIQEILSLKEKIKFRSTLRNELSREYIYADIILQSNEELESKRDIPGNVVHYAMKEAVKL